jgi:hypothetical protein
MLENVAPLLKDFLLIFYTNFLFPFQCCMPNPCGRRLREISGRTSHHSWRVLRRILPSDLLVLHLSPTVFPNYCFHVTPRLALLCGGPGSVPGDFI